MESLLASAGPIEASSSSSAQQRPFKPRKPLPHQTVQRGKNKDSIDPSLHSILSSTRLSSSLQSTQQDVKPSAHLQKIGDKKLRAKLAAQQVANKRSTNEREQVQEYLNNTGQDGGIEVDLEAGERTWRVKQDEIVDAVGLGSAGKKFDLKLDVVGGGGYRIDYTRNGR
jgi:U3 small nucleolar RNA-associated protein 7